MADSSAALAAQLGLTPASSPQPDAGSDSAALAASLGLTPAPAAAPAAAPTQDAEPKSDLGGSVIAGLKQTFAPHLLTKEELDKQKTGAETAVEVGTNLATDVATGAAIGTLVGPEGTLLGAGAGALIHVAMAAYRGFGYEYARAKADGQDFNPMRGTLNSLAQINPLVGMGGKWVKAGTQAALEFGAQYQYSKDATSAGVAGAVGGVIAGLTHQNTGQLLAFIGVQASRPTSQTARSGMTHGMMEGAMLIAGDESETGLATRFAQGMKAAKEQDPEFFTLGDKLYQAKLDPHPSDVGAKQASNQLRSHMDDFKRFVLDQPGMSVQNGDVNGAFAHVQRVRGDEFMDEAYKTFQQKNVWNAQVSKFLVEAETDVLGRNAVGDIVPKAESTAPVGKIADPLKGTFVDKITDIKFVMRKIDDTLGTNFEGSISNFGAAKDKANNIAVTYVKRMNALMGEARKQKLSPQEIGQWLAENDINKSRAMVAGMNGTAKQAVSDIAANWTAEQRAVGQGYRQLFKDARNVLENEGLKIDFLNGQTFEEGGKYLPMRAQTGPEAAKSMRTEIARLTDKHGPDYLNSSDSSELRRVVAKTLNREAGTDLEPEAIVYRNQVERATDLMIQKGDKSATGFSGGMAMQREIGLPAPEFIRDYDVNKLMLGYINNGLKATVYQDSFMQLKSQLSVLQAMGFENSAAYIQKYMGHISGHQSDFVSGLTMLANKHKDTIEKLIEGINPDSAMAGVKTAALKGVRDLPDFAGFAISSIYPNFLGFNIRAAGRDLAKPFLLTAPELGWNYGLKTVMKSLVSSAWDKVHGGVDFEKALRAKDLMPAAHLGVMGDVADSGLRSKAVVGPAVEMVEKLNVLSMAMYSKSDMMNRYIQMKVGQHLAEDLVAGHPNALKYVQRTLSEGNKNALRELGIESVNDLQKVDVKKLGDELGRQLVDKTSFQYGKEGMNEFGRDMGRVFSMFTKWPAMIMSDSADLVRRSGGFVSDGSGGLSGVWNGGGARIAKRYIAPMAALTLASEYLLDTEHNPTERFLVGKSLNEWAPAQSWKIGTPPLLQTGQDFGKTMMDLISGEHDRLATLGKFSKNTLAAYVPGAAVYNEITRANKAWNPEEYK